MIFVFPYVILMKVKNPKTTKEGKRHKMKAVITVVGKDMVGILAKVSGECAKYNANVIEVTQSVLQDMFARFII